ncbi:hypothetical protein Taro_039985 [Colocasia esculenta]|uniref:Uncharacterized protein n=1 Tax=Colocasia esculenta TaxID=4460 RepID=A0A843WHX6_COLES|nr:hypothetical protein [Colocasia esculenta]
MRDTMNVITRLGRTINERLDAMAEVEGYRMKLGIYVAYDMRCTNQRLTPEQKHYQRRRKMLKKGKAVGSDDSTQSPDDDDDGDDDGAAAGMVQKLGRIGIGSAESARFWASRSEPG